MSGPLSASNYVRGEWCDMGIVTDYLTNMIARQVDTHGLVIWFDPERHYTALAEQLALLDTTILRYEGSFLALRYQAEKFINEAEPPRLVI